MNPEEHEQQSAQSIVRFAQSLSTYYVDEHDQEAAIIAILVRALVQLTPGYTHRLFDRETKGE